MLGASRPRTQGTTPTSSPRHASSRVLRWCILVEDFNPTLIHIKGEQNITADGLSCAPMEEAESPEALFEAHVFSPPLQPNDPVFPIDFDLIADEQPQGQQLQGW